MDKTLFLTFDDGPSEPHTSQIVEILNDFGARATFFVCGANIEKTPLTLEKIARAGHALGNHTYAHNFRTVLRAGSGLLEEIEVTQKLIEKYVGTTLKLYRSPRGMTMPWLKSRLLAKGYQIYLWNLMAFDWWQPSVNFIVRHVVRRAFPGAIVLLHDGFETRDTAKNHTVEALPQILKKLTEQGYRFRALDGKQRPRAIAKNYIIDLWQGFQYRVGVSK